MDVKDNPYVTIVIPVYNGKAVVKDCLDSVFNIDYKDFEIVLVDDCSSDGCSGFIASNYGGVRIFKTQRRSGFAKAVNLGIKEAKGEIIVLLNMDAVVDRMWLTPLVAALTADKKIGLAGSKILNSDWKTLQHAGGLLLANGLSVHIGRDELDGGQYDSIKDVDYLCGASLGFRKDTIIRLGFFDEGFRPLYYEDADLAYRAGKNGLRAVYIPESVLMHREATSTNGLSEAFYRNYHKGRMRFIFKNYSIKDIILKFMPAEARLFMRGLPSVKKVLTKIYITTFFSNLKLLIKKEFKK